MLGGMRWDEGEVRKVAAAGHGLVDRQTATGMGASDTVIARRIVEGTWKPIHPGVYDLDVTPKPWVSRVHAAVLAGGPETVASHRTAGMLWGLDGIGGRVIELTVPVAKGPTPRDVIVHRTRRRLPYMLVEAVPTTVVERTLLDLAALLPPIVLEKVMMSALHKHLTTADAVAVAIAVQGGRGVRGTRKLRRTLALVDGGITGSPSEVEFMALLRKAPIPQPVCQFEIRFPEGDHVFPDFAWTDRRKCVEVDGFDAHGTPEALEQDLIRQNRLLELGWELRRFSARQIRRDPIGVIDEIVRFVQA
jgi:hypothetical protein